MVWGYLILPPLLYIISSVAAILEVSYGLFANIVCLSSLLSQALPSPPLQIDYMALCFLINMLGIRCQSMQALLVPATISSSLFLIPGPRSHVTP